MLIFMNRQQHQQKENAVRHRGIRLIYIYNYSKYYQGASNKRESFFLSSFTIIHSFIQEEI
jgi:hypothetical protein